MTLTPDETIHVTSPFLAVASDTGVWVSSDRAVVRIDPKTGATTSIVSPVPAGSASGLAAWGAQLSESDFDAGTVDVFDTSTSRIVATVPVADGPRSLFVDGGTPWVFEERANAEARVDVPNKRVAATVRVPGPIGVAFGSWWSTTREGGSLERLDPMTASLRATIPVPSDAGACEMNVLPGLERIGDALATFCLGDAAAARPKVAVVSAATNAVVGTVDAQGQPFGGSVVVGGRWWLIEGPIGGPGRFVRVDTTSWSIDRTLVVGPQFDPDAAVVVGNELYVPIDPGQQLDEVLRFPLASLQ